MVDRIVLHAENGRDDSFWDEKLAIRDKAACRISSEGCLGIAKEDFEKFRGQIVKVTVLWQPRKLQLTSLETFIGDHEAHGMWE